MYCYCSEKNLFTLNDNIATLINKSGDPINTGVFNLLKAPPKTTWDVSKYHPDYEHVTVSIIFRDYNKPIHWGETFEYDSNTGLVLVGKDYRFKSNITLFNHSKNSLDLQVTQLRRLLDDETITSLELPGIFEINTKIRNIFGGKAESRLKKGRKYIYDEVNRILPLK